MNEPLGTGASPPAHLDREQQTVLLEVADQAIRTALESGRAMVPDPADAPHGLDRPGASFVTLRRRGALLGCIGSIEARRPLIEDVARNALAAAFDDPRLPAVTLDDYRELEISVSVLTPMVPLDAGDLDDLRRQIRPGIDGLLIESPGHRATFLPSVWKQLPDPDEFLEHLWLKAGLRPGAWPPGLRIERYGTEEFGSAPPRTA